MPKKTVRDFKNFVVQETGSLTCDEFCQISDAHLDFWRMLNNLWTDLENPRPEDVKDVDAAIELLDEEWEELEGRFYRIVALERRKSPSREEKIKKIIKLAKKRRAEFSAWEKAYLEGGGSRNDDLYLEKYNIWEELGHLVSIFRREL